MTNSAAADTATPAALLSGRLDAMSVDAASAMMYAASRKNVMPITCNARRSALSP